MKNHLAPRDVDETPHRFKRFLNGKVYINSIGSFWSFAKERLMKYNALNPKKIRSLP
jgi:hypothetical protein